MFGHELTHSAEKAKAYSSLQTAVERYLAKEYGAGEFIRRTIEIITSREGTPYAVSQEGARAEVVANFISEQLFKSEHDVMRFVAENRTVGQQILEGIRSMLRKVTRGHAGYGTLKDAERLFAKALRQTEKAEKSQQKNGNAAKSQQKNENAAKTSQNQNIFYDEDASENITDYEAYAERLRERLRSGDITEEEFDELWEKNVETNPAYRSDIDSASAGVMGYTDARNAEVNQEKQFSAEDNVQWSIGDIYGENGYYGIGVILDTDIFDGVSPRNWGTVLGDYVYNNLAGTELTMYDENGDEEKVYLAKYSDRVRKTGAKNSHRVIDKLAKHNGNNIRALSTVHLSELLKTSGNETTTNDKSHQWLDSNGWILRTSYVMDKKGNIYKATLNIADGIRGKILYDINKIKRIDGGDVPSTVSGRGSLSSINSKDSISQSPDSVNRQFSVSKDDSSETTAKMQNAIHRAGVEEKLVRASGDDATDTLAAVEAQREQLEGTYLDDEAPSTDVPRSYNEDGVEIPLDPNEGYWVGYNSAADAVKALAQGKLSKAKGVELAELIGMPKVDGETVVPFRTWFAIEPLGTYERRDTGETVPVAGYALPVVNQSGLWIHYFDAESGTNANDFFTWDELTKTKAQHIPSYAELNSYRHFLEDGGNRLVPEDLAPTAEDIREWEARETDNTFINNDEFYAANGVYEKMAPKTKYYVNRALRDFRVKMKNAFKLPTSRLDVSQVLQASDALAADFINNGGFIRQRADKIFDSLIDQSLKIDGEFYEQYKEVLKELRNAKVAISREDADDLYGGFDSFRKRAAGYIMGVSYRESGKDRISVDSYYQHLTETYPELFPANITNPAEQLERLLSVAKEISSARGMTTTPSAEMRNYAKNEFTAALGELVHPLQNAIRMTVEEQSDAALASKSFEDEARSVMETGKKIPHLLRAIKKLQYKVLLTGHDESVVGDLLSGYVTEDAVRASERNAEEIISMYKVRKPYEEAISQVREFRSKIAKQQREIAKNVLGDVTQWKDKSGIFYNFVDMPRIIDRIAPDAETAQRFKDTYITPLKENNAKAVRYIEGIRQKVKAMELSRKVVKGDAVSESAVVQLLGEARAAQAILREQAKDPSRSKKQQERDGLDLDGWIRDEAIIWEMNPSLNNPESRARIEGAVEEFRKIYDKILDDMNMALVKEGLAPIAKRAGYFPHFTKEQSEGIFAKVRRLFGISNDVNALPTEIAGLTGNFKPNRQWFQNAMSRTVNSREAQLETVLYDAVEGLDRYVEVASNLIHHTQDITRFRALERQIRIESASEAVKRDIMRIEQSKELSEDQKQEEIAKRTNGQRYALSGFAQMLTEYTNKLAGKTSIIDRGVESLCGRDVFNITKGIMKKYAVNATSSLSSALTNFLPLAQGSGGYSFADLGYAALDLIRHNGVIDESSFVTARQGSNRLVKTKVEKLGDKSRLLFEKIDGLVSTLTVQARYRHNIKRGLSHESALREADAWSAALIGDRSMGGQALVFESNNPIFKMFTQFQLEVNNQMLRAFYDMPAEAKQIWSESGNRAEGVYRLVSYFAKSAFFTWVLNGFMEKVVGRGPGGDWIGIIFEAIATGTGFDLFDWMFDWVPGIDEDEEDEGEGAAGFFSSLASGALEEVPFVGGLFGGGRIPIMSLQADIPTLYNAWTDKEASWQSKVATTFSELSTPLIYLTLPFGGSQIKKTGVGLADFLRGGAYSYSKTGEPMLKYPISGVGELLQSLTFGTTSTPGGQQWVEDGFKTLSAKATRAYKGAVNAGASEHDAYDLVKGFGGLKNGEDPEGSATTLQKVQYLDNCDFSDEVKCAVYYDMIASDDENQEITERKVMTELMEEGIDTGELYRVLSGIRNVQGERDEALKDGDDYDLTKAKIAVLTSSTLPVEAIEKIYVAQGGKANYNKMVNIGVDEDSARAISYDFALLAPLEGKKTVSDIQKMRVILNADLGDLESAALASVANESNERKLTLIDEYEIDADSFVRMQEYIAEYNDNNSTSQSEAKEAIDSLSDSFLSGVSGTVPKNLTRSQKAVLWQICNKSWNPGKNPYDASVGRKVAAAMEEWE